MREEFEKFLQEKLAASAGNQSSTDGDVKVLDFDDFRVRCTLIDKADGDDDDFVVTVKVEKRLQHPNHSGLKLEVYN